MNKNRISFSQSPKPTLGVEAELYTVSKDTFNLCPGAPVILDTFADDIHVKEELLECIVEVNTGICNDVAEVRSDLTNTIRKVQKVVNENKCRATRYGMDAEIIIDETGNLQPLKDSIVDTIDKLIKVAIGLGCREKLEKLADIAENNQAPFKRQIIQYEKNNDLTDIVKESINGLKEGLVV